MTRSSSKRPTVRDVARIAGVSTATVSRALQSPDIVSKKTRDAVFAAVKDTGYSINTAAQMLRRNRSGTVLVILPDISNPFFSKILSGIEEVATRANLTILIGNTNGDKTRYTKILENLRNGRADGALILNGLTPPEGALPEGTPAVSISERLDGSGYPHVGTDNRKAAFDATRYLIEQGHLQIAHITGPQGNILTEDRLSGYVQAMTEAGLTDFIRSIAGGFTYADGEQAADQLIREWPGTTAAFCANDESAMGLIRQLQQKGYSVPDQVSVMGFDDVPFSRIFRPELTTVHQARHLIGQRAMEILLEHLQQGSPSSDVVYLDHSIVVRRSVGRPAQ